MPSFVVKPNRDEDFYVYWSTVVDAPTAFGSRAEMLQHHEITPDRMRRADLNGTSAHDVRDYGWDDRAFLVCNIDFAERRNDHSYSVPRKKVRELCERLHAGKDVGDLLVPEKNE